MTSGRNPERVCMNQKKKNEKSIPIETEYPTTENVENASSITQWKKGTTLFVGNSILAGNVEKCISGNRTIKVRIFPGAATRDM